MLSAGICGTLYITQSGNECAGEPCAAVSRKCIHGVAPSVSIPLYTTMLPVNCWASLEVCILGQVAWECAMESTILGKISYGSVFIRVYWWGDLSQETEGG